MGFVKFWGKNHPIFQKVALKNTPISTKKLKLKAPNIYIKTPLKAKNTYSKPCFECPYLCARVCVCVCVSKTDHNLDNHPFLTSSIMC